MSIRTRLLVLLLILALVPTALLGLSTLRSLDDLGDRVGAEAHEALLEAEFQRLRQKVADAVVLYGRQSDSLEHLLADQAEAAEAALAMATEGTKWIPASDFDAGKVSSLNHDRFARLTSDGSSQPVPVSLEHVAIHFASGTSPVTESNNAGRLATLASAYARLSDLGQSAVIWHYTSLESGLHSAYPGHGGYSPEYDPRTRGWYREATEKARLIWSPPYIDVVTQTVVTSIARPIRNAEGKIIGVTGIDVSAPRMFQGFSAEVDGWRDESEAIIVMPTPERGITVLGRERAGSKGHSLHADPAETTLADPNGELIAAFARARTSLNPVLLRHPHRGEDALWALAPIRSGGAFLAVVVPAGVVEGAANRLGGLVARDFSTQRMRVVLGLVITAALVIGAAFWTARDFTAPMEIVSATARAVSLGDLGSRAQVERRDEIGSLADSVNGMAASLEKLIEEQEEATLQALKALTQALQKKDRDTAGHSGRVKHYSLKLGERLGLDLKTLDLLGRGALLHDIGKIGIPDAVLNKAGPLDEDELQIMRQHPTFTAAIMKPLLRFRAFAEIAAWHHERWDGTGYPNGLAGEDIPLLARIVAIADTWDAMTADRVYRKGIPIQKAHSILEASVDEGQFDPEILRHFLAMIREEQEPEELSG